MTALNTNLKRNVTELKMKSKSRVYVHLVMVNVSMYVSIVSRRTNAKSLKLKRKKYASMLRMKIPAWDATPNQSVDRQVEY